MVPRHVEQILGAQAVQADEILEYLARNATSGREAIPKHIHPDLVSIRGGYQAVARTEASHRSLRPEVSDTPLSVRT